MTRRRNTSVNAPCSYLTLKGPCATRRNDTMEGNSRRLYQGGGEPLGRSGWWMQAIREKAALKMYR
jgi:hypothetical protein